jgi:uncharacterized protein (TIGR03790 family)
LAARALRAGESGLNVIVVVNQNSTNSVQLGNDYCEKRGVPPQNFVRMTGWTGGNIAWDRPTFESLLRNPVLSAIAGRGLTNQAEVVLLSMDIPYRISDSNSQNSTTSTMFYGFKYDTAPPEGLPPSCSLPDSSSNSYAYSEQAFRDARPNTATTNSFLTFMLTDNDLASAEAILSRGVASDGTSPTQAVWLARTSDPDRNVRYFEFDNAITDCHIRGDTAVNRIDTDSTTFTNILGLLTGLANLGMPPNVFVVGAMADSLTSYGGDLFEQSYQSSLLEFLNSGAAGSYGTIYEPCNYLQKFPDPMDYFYQARGFCVAEAYYQSVLNPYQGLLAGEPLAAPFARRGSADWSSLTNGASLSGSAPLNLTFASAATNLPLGQVDLFLDGTFIQTVTNLPPASGNTLSTTLNSTLVSYTIPPNATVPSAVSGFAAAINTQSNSTHIRAIPVGDRIILLSQDPTTAGSNVTASAGAALGSGSRLTTLLNSARPTFFDTAATGIVTMIVSNTPAIGDWLRLSITKTNGALVNVAVTNATSGATIGDLAASLLSLVNGTAALQTADGLGGSDLYYDPNLFAAQFTLVARSLGYPASQIKAALTCSAGLLIAPVGTNRLQDNLSDLQPRNHFYVSSGVTNLPVSFVLNTALYPDGYHELAVVATQGDSVRTQTRVTRSVQFHNTSLSATFTSPLVGTNATLDMPLKFTVSANTASISRIELFSTGGSSGVVSNQQTVTFLAPSAMLGLGLHPFYAVATDNSGHQFRTQTINVRIIPSIKITLTSPPLALNWPTIPGLRYEVLSTTNLALPFSSVASFVASNSTAQWPVPVVGRTTSYRIRLDP